MKVLKIIVKVVATIISSVLVFGASGALGMLWSFLLGKIWDEKEVMEQ